MHLRPRPDRTVPKRAASPSPAHVIGRIGAGLLGSWVWTWGFAALGITSLVAIGQPYAEAHMAVMLLAFLVFLAAFCWAFAARNLARVWFTLIGGGAAMTGLGWMLQSQLV